MGSRAVRSPREGSLDVVKEADYFFPSALSFLAMLKACQPGIPFTPPPPCVAHDPWYRPRTGVRKSA